MSKKKKSDSYEVGYPQLPSCALQYDFSGDGLLEHQQDLIGRRLLASSMARLQQEASPL